MAAKGLPTCKSRKAGKRRRLVLVALAPVGVRRTVGLLVVVRSSRRYRGGRKAPDCPHPVKAIMPPAW